MVDHDLRITTDAGTVVVSITALEGGGATEVAGVLTEEYGDGVAER